MKILDHDLQSIQEVRVILAAAKQAQKVLQSYSQEQIDHIVAQVAAAAEQSAVKLAQMAHEETGFGRWEDKAIKNTFASRQLYRHIKDMKTVGVIAIHETDQIVDIAVPVGVIAGLIPSTNPTSTVIYKSLLALKTGNAIVFSPHPSARRCISETVALLSSAAVQAGAPEGILGCLSILSMPGTNELMKHRDTSLILATGGEAMVKAAYSSGTPAIGVGPGNGPAFIERSADIPRAVKQIIDSKTFDYGVICASEQSIVVEKESRQQVVQELLRQGAYFLNSEQSAQLGSFLLRGNGTINPQAVGKSPERLAAMAGFSIPAGSRVLISEQTTVSRSNPYSREKLAPVLAFYEAEDWKSACERCMELLEGEGKGHTMTIHSRNEAVIQEFALHKQVSRLLVNTPAALGGIGATTNLPPAMTLGCGTVGGSSTSDNIGPMNLLNIRRLAYGVREMEDLREPVPVCAAKQVTAEAAAVSAAPAAPTAPTAMNEAQLEAIVQQLLRQLMG
ncbi:acetaldehyde dehydrogenase (acetylating) [Paenibacillus macerans]|uniref:acetaldehyde dehydrogenase (acetylating) n=1 Tax=Paenibacillus macerans TaxID=44252 RepID=UPI000EE5B338|nr:acetaldehyde dehydrogenase (acetylating) [Paenibacillus macerans]GBK64680.1 acetaldehyde dehydrogenase [Paenibacillus macerans]GBK70886.1 acetaldehyde dehydrogenase [Paenibacillus macerans]